MALIKTIQSHSPSISKGVKIAENASIIGDVSILEHSSVWYGVVIRGDVNAIQIGAQSNIQDNVVIHGTYKKQDTRIGNRVTIGHGAIIHGCTIEDDVLIGMGAIILDGAHIKSHSIIAAGSVVKANTIVEQGSLFAGNPAVFKKALDIADIKRTLKTQAEQYMQYAHWNF